MQRWVLATAWLAALGASPSCKPSAAPAPAPEPLAYAIDGCAEVRPGPICEVEADAIVTLWVATASSAVRLEPPDVEVLAVVALDAGTRITLRPSDAERTVRVVARDRATPGIRLRRARLVACPADGTIDDHTGAEARAACLRAAAIGTFGAPEMIDQGIDDARRAQALYLEVGALRSFARTRALEGSLLFHAGRTSEAEARLRPFVETATISEALRLAARMPLGDVADSTGDLVHARREFEATRRWAARLDNRRLSGMASGALLYVLEQLRDFEGADRIAQALLVPQPDLEPCDAKQRLAWVHWWTLVRRTQPFRRLDRPIASELKGIALSDLREHLANDLEACPTIRGDVAINLALEALLLHRSEEAAHWAKTSHQLGMTPRNRAWLAEAEAEMFLATGQPRAALRALDDPSLDHANRKLALATLVVRAEAYGALGDFDRAESAWVAASDLLDAWPGSVELESDFEGITSTHYQAAQSRVGFLIRRGRFEDALREARHARVRALYVARRIRRVEGLYLAARSEWYRHTREYRRVRDAIDALREPRSDAEEKEQAVTRATLLERAHAALVGARRVLWNARPKDPTVLSPVAASELLLMFHPDRTRWHALWRLGDRRGAIALAELPSSPTTLAVSIEEALESLDALIEPATQIRVLAVGVANEIDVHALSWRGRPLGQQRPVVYGVDVGAEPAPGRERTRAVVVVDPERDDMPALPHAEVEGQRAVERFEHRGFDVTRVEGRSATLERVRSEIERAEAFYFAGHATPDRDIGTGLALAGTQSFGVSDALGLSRAPSVVIASACGSAAVERRDRVTPDLGVAQAFVLAGADVVVATTRPVDDALAAAIGDRVTSDFEDATRIAASIGTASVAGDWSAYRVFVP